MPWEKQYNETEVLERAMHAFWAQGYEATSISDLVHATGLNRGSLYTAFDDKHGLFVEALRHYDRHHRADFLDGIARAHAPRQAITAVFESAAENTGACGRPAGCLLVNTALELSPHDPEIRALVSASLAEVELFFRKMIGAAKEEGSVPDHIAPEATAKSLLGLLLGLRVLTRSGADRETLDAVVAQASALIG